jgi:acetyl esterase
MRKLSVEEPVDAPVNFERPPLGLGARVRRRLGAAVVDNLFLQSARLGRLLPISAPGFHQVEVQKDVPYRDTGAVEHLLDVYRPAGAAGKRPVVLYLHGGGFRFMSKDTHWLFGLAYARRGYLVFNVNYRLAPRHPYPAAIDDACAAYTWVARNAERLGGDLSRLVVAGESAGANLALGVTLASCYRRPEPFAREVFDTGVSPRVTVPVCGMLQVSDPERFLRRRHLPPMVHDRLAEVTDAYFHGYRPPSRQALELADPLCMLERGQPPDRPLPAFFAPCGTRDPLLDDTRRLKRALEQLGIPCRAPIFPGELHAFHALVFRDGARRCWRELFSFLDAHLHRQETARLPGR